MDNSPEQYAHTTVIDEWVQTALSAELLYIFDNEWLDICQVDRVARALDDVRRLCRLPPRDEKASLQYPGLIVLHCVNYREMNETTLSHLPDVLLSVLGLDAQSGPLFLGVDRWSEVHQHFRHPKSGVSLVAVTAPLLTAPQQKLERCLRADSIRDFLDPYRALGALMRAKGSVSRAWLTRALRSLATRFAKKTGTAEPTLSECDELMFAPRSSLSQPASHHFCDSFADAHTASGSPGSSWTPCDSSVSSSHVSVNPIAVRHPSIPPSDDQ